MRSELHPCLVCRVRRRRPEACAFVSCGRPYRVDHRTCQDPSPSCARRVATKHRRARKLQFTISITAPTCSRGVTHTWSATSNLLPLSPSASVDLVSVVFVFVGALQLQVMSVECSHSRVKGARTTRRVGRARPCGQQCQRNDCESGVGFTHAPP